MATIFFADNVRPTLDGEALDTAQEQLARAFDSFTEQRGMGFDEISYMSRVGVLPTAQSYHAIVSYLGKTAEHGGVLALDVGSAVSTLSASVRRAYGDQHPHRSRLGAQRPQRDRRGGD